MDSALQAIIARLRESGRVPNEVRSSLSDQTGTAGDRNSAFGHCRSPTGESSATTDVTRCYVARITRGYYRGSPDPLQPRGITPFLFFLDNGVSPVSFFRELLMADIERRDLDILRPRTATASPAVSR